MFTAWLLWIALGCAFVPALALASIWSAARPLIVNDDSAYFGALRDSQELSAGYGGKALGVVVVHALLWAVVVVNLFLGVQLLLSLTTSATGADLSRIGESLSYTNRAYLLLLFCLGFLLLDPLKTTAEAILYLDLRVRRDGADLYQRLDGLRARYLPAVLALLCLLPSLRASAMPLGEYQQKVRNLRARVERANSPKDIPPEEIEALSGQTVTLPDGRKLSVENEWLDRAIKDWDTDESQRAVSHRLKTLERYLGPPVAAGAGAPAPPSAGSAAAPLPESPEDAVKSVLSQPQYQELAERPELRELLGKVEFKPLENTWARFWKWVQKHLLKPWTPRVRAPEINLPSANAMRGVLNVVLIVVGAVLLTMLISSLFRRWQGRGEAITAAEISEALPLEAAETENALEHSVDEWEQFARAFLAGGDFRQAIRALYLATLVYLHRQRLIDYNRARTNWHYVRHFRGETGSRSVLRALTQAFDEVWYGGFPYGPEEYQRFEQGVRELGTPAPVGGPSGG